MDCRNLRPCGSCPTDPTKLLSEALLPTQQGIGLIGPVPTDPTASILSAHILDTHQAAAYLRLSVSSLNKMRCTGSGPAFIRMGRSVRYRRRALDSFIDSRCATRTDAEAALRRLRKAFRTFPFGDASRRWDASHNVELIDLREPPGRDESAFLLALITAVCRPSLWLAPGMLFTASAVSGAGSGKGLLVRAICAITRMALHCVGGNIS